MQKMIVDKSHIMIKKIIEFLEKEIGICEEAVLLCTIKILYMILTVHILSNQWYVGYGSYGVDFNPIKEIFSCVIFVAVMCIYLKRKISNFYLKLTMQILFVMYYIPLNSAFSIHNASFLFGVLSNIYFALIIWLTSSKCLDRLINFLLQKKEIIVKGAIKKQIAVLFWFCFVVTVIYIIFKISYNGFDFLVTINGDEVYSTRASFQEYMDKISGTLWAYILTIIQNLFSYAAPVYLFLSLKDKKYVHLLIALLGIVSEYSIASSKATIFFVVVVVAVYFFDKWGILNKMQKLFYYGILSLMLLCVITMLIGKNSIYMLLIRRELFFPSWLATIYYDYFSSHPKICWSKSVLILQNLLNSSYADQPVDIISREYFQGLVPSPNTGLFAEAYMHFGVWGIILYAILICALLKVSAKIYKEYGRGIVTLIAVKVVLHMLNVPILRTDFMMSYFLFTAIVGFISLCTDREEKPISKRKIQWWNKIKNRGNGNE